jgi:cation:H+ antiporter
MEMLVLFAGLVGLWLGTEITIRGAISIASSLRISELVVGLLVLSLGSNLPELAVAADAAINTLHGGHGSDVVVGCALGSALGQIGFVLGIAGLIDHLTLSKPTVYRHGSMLLGSLLLLGLFGSDGIVSRVEGLALVTVYAVYFGLLLRKSSRDVTADDASTLPLRKSLLYLFVGLSAVAVAADLTVSSASHVARTFGIEESFIAVVVIGLGTSLPELSISVGAILKRRNRMSIGNLVGSNIFDTLVPIGVASIIADISFDGKWLTVELPFLFLLSTFAMILLATTMGIQRFRAAAILCMYCAYVMAKFATS